MAQIEDPQPDTITPQTFDDQVSPLEQFALQNGGMTLKSAFFQSPNYKAGVDGWKINKNGDVEFNTGFFRGNVTLPSLTVGTNVNIGIAQTAGQVTTIIGNTVTTGYVNALSVVAGSVAAENITGTTITGKTIIGGLIETSTSGKRVLISGANNDIEFYDQYGNSAGSIYGFYSSGSIIFINGSLFSNGNLAIGGAGTFTGNVGFGSYVTIGGVARNTWPSSGVSSLSQLSIDGAKYWNGYGISGVGSISCSSVGGNVGAFTFTGGGHITTNTHLDPSSSGSLNCGGSSYYWNAMNAHYFTKQGGFGSFDVGVELQDKTVVSDLDAILGMTQSNTMKSKYADSRGAIPRIEPSTIPVAVIHKAADNNGNLYPRDENDRPYIMEKGVKRELDDGEDLGAMLSIIIGAIKELNNKIDNIK